MKEIRIITKTVLGEKALDKNIKEYYKLPFHSRTMLNSTISRKVTKDPLTLILRIKNSFLAKALDEHAFTNGLRKSMNEEGVKENKDYEVVIIE